MLKNFKSKDILITIKQTNINELFTRVGFMDILISIIYIVLFLVMMIFVFSIGMLRPFMPKKEIVLVLIVSFFIGAIGGAVFLNPVYQETPEVISAIQKLNPSNEETVYLDLSSSTDVSQLKNDLSKMEGFKSFEETGITINMWRFNDKEYKYFNNAVGNVDSHFTNYTVNKSSGTIYIALDNNYSSSQALSSFSEWYKFVFGDSINYALIHTKLVVSSSSLDKFESYLLNKGIVPSHVDGPSHIDVNSTNNTAIHNNEFIIISGFIGFGVGLIGLYYDSFVVAFRRIKRLLFQRKKL